VEKFRIYEKYGVSEYWIFYTELKVIEVFVLKRNV
jgi:Uma2 family endonuclease